VGGGHSRAGSFFREYFPSGNLIFVSPPFHPPVFRNAPLDVENDVVQMPLCLVKGDILRREGIKGIVDV
jgi:hypothetical protein